MSLLDLEMSIAYNLQSKSTKDLGCEFLEHNFTHLHFNDCSNHFFFKPSLCNFLKSIRKKPATHTHNHVTVQILLNARVFSVQITIQRRLAHEFLHFLKWHKHVLLHMLVRLCKKLDLDCFSKTFFFCGFRSTSFHYFLLRGILTWLRNFNWLISAE